MIKFIIVLIALFALFWAVIMRTQMIIDKVDDLDVSQQCHLTIVDGESHD
jgi:hypothetical protein